MQAFIDESLDNVLPKFRQCAKYFQDFTRLFALWTKYLKLRNREWDSTKNNVLVMAKCIVEDY